VIYALVLHDGADDDDDARVFTHDEAIKKVGQEVQATQLFA
jgi:hypothetical protein